MPSLLHFDGMDVLCNDSMKQVIVIDNRYVMFKGFKGNAVIISCDHLCKYAGWSLL
jgi:hypothetical protein